MAPSDRRFYGCPGTVGMLRRHAPGRTSAISWRGALGNTNGVGDVAWNEIPGGVGDHKAESTCNVVLGT